MHKIMEYHNTCMAIIIIMYTLTSYIPGPSCLSWGERPGDTAIIDSCVYVFNPKLSLKIVYKPHALIRQGMHGFLVTRDISMKYLILFTSRGVNCTFHSCIYRYGFTQQI